MRALALAGALMVFGAPAALARMRDVWVAAVPNWWNVAPNGHDAIMGMPVNPGTRSSRRSSTAATAHIGAIRCPTRATRTPTGC